MKNPETTGHVIKVAIADDHTLFRSGVKVSLTAHKDIHMVAEAENGMQLLNLLKHIQPDVVLLDISPARAATFVNRCAAMRGLFISLNACGMPAS